MLVGLYGGTFDPVHLGHTHAALSVKAKLGFSEVRMVLAARPGHRVSAGDKEHRWQMLCLACAEHPGLVADDVEIRRAGASYTIDTVAGIRAAEPLAIPCWILGQDSFATLPTWEQWESLLEFCNLIVVSRPGGERSEPAEVVNLCKEHEVRRLEPAHIGQICRLRLPMKKISATQIRNALARGEQVEHLLAAPVYTYIRQHSLYVTTENTI